ncbi:MAG: hypothetical protein BWX86_00234 [Verrucomicrobia bacterium ADurb.Bin122]|nr:MAG: hypothetical protein BWX86_00234 [Verrucomicrobia bacterium ADurb.Bin122]
MPFAAAIAALELPAAARVGKRVPKKLLLENGAPTAADKRAIGDGIDELFWVAALKPATLGVSEFRDAAREYLELAVLTITLRPGARGARLAELVHRAIPYPVLLLRREEAGLVLSLAHLRQSQGAAGQTVLDGAVIESPLGEDAPSRAFLASLAVAAQPRAHLHAFYQGWIERAEALAAGRRTGRFALAGDPAAAGRRRTALAEHEELAREIAGLRARATKETQLARRVELNLRLKELESRLAAAAALL